MAGIFCWEGEGQRVTPEGLVGDERKGVGKGTLPLWGTGMVREGDFAPSKLNFCLKWYVLTLNF